MQSDTELIYERAPLSGSLELFYDPKFSTERRALCESTTLDWMSTS